MISIVHQINNAPVLCCFSAWALRAVTLYHCSTYAFFSFYRFPAAQWIGSIWTSCGRGLELSSSGDLDIPTKLRRVRFCRSSTQPHCSTHAKDYGRAIPFSTREEFTLALWSTAHLFRDAESSFTFQKCGFGLQQGKSVWKIYVIWVQSFECSWKSGT